MKKTILLFLFFLFPCLSFGAESYTTSCSRRSSLPDYQENICLTWDTTLRADGSYRTSCSRRSSLPYYQENICLTWDTK